MHDDAGAPGFESRVPADLSVAFQPIIDTVDRTVFSYEALLRGSRGEPAGSLLARVGAADMHRFDQICRDRAIRMAVQLGMDTHINLNLLPNGVFGSGQWIKQSLDAARSSGFPLHRIILEVTEGEAIEDHGGFARLINAYRRQGIKLAIDDFGAGYAGLNLLADFQPDLVKIDMSLVRGIQSNGPRQAIVRGIWQVCTDLGIDVIAEGVETREEYQWFAQLGVRLFQGYLFAKPGFECLPPVLFPATSTVAPRFRNKGAKGWCRETRREEES
ncbi:MAG: signaling protein containing domain [Hydrocarboniphaga sp.]|uniref:EAL domain-containing protein n=1 Tax=Hydrocarboniphaga sp. TaxID=2033016 RepID=UPI002613020E|nr:EAL domain-containing protein [Hydrocarboniphaga sp.]MDB5971975.1 signaling protein containing domain [Hydrocarboniphaga sp.]